MKTKEAPEKVYLEIEKENGEIIHVWGSTPVISDSWEHVEYIRKDALLKWAKERLHNVEPKGNEGDVFAQGMHAGFGAIISKLSSL